MQSTKVLLPLTRSPRTVLVLGKAQADQQLQVTGHGYLNVTQIHTSPSSGDIFCYARLEVVSFRRLRQPVAVPKLG